MSGPAGANAEPCTDCDKVRIEKALEAEEAVRVFQRDLEKLYRQRDLDSEKRTEEQKLTLDKAEGDALTALEKSRWDAEAELAKIFHQTIADVAKGSIERSRDSAKFVQTASTAVVAVYTGILGLVFSVTDNPLPLRGVYAAVFLGLAIALATAYLAFITKPRAPALYPGGSSLTEMQLYRTGYLTKWVNATVTNRRWAIRASVLSLAIGVAFIPAAFVASARPTKIPAAPTVPEIPSEIATAVSDEAVELFRAQVQGYTAANAARNQAIKKSAEKAKSAVNRETRLNDITRGLAILGLIVVFFGPLVFAGAEDARRWRRLRQGESS